MNVVEYIKKLKSPFRFWKIPLFPLPTVAFHIYYIFFRTTGEEQDPPVDTFGLGRMIRPVVGARILTADL